MGPRSIQPFAKSTATLPASSANARASGDPINTPRANAVSELFAKKPDHRVLSWFNAQQLSDLFLTSIVLAELYFGAYAVKDEGRQIYFLQGIGRLCRDFDRRIAVFETSAAERYGWITAARKAAGRPIETKDAIIAAICLIHNATLATRDVRDFEGLGLRLVDPFEAGT